MNPYRVLGIAEETDDDEAIRQAWLENVRRFPPEHDAEQFARVREAYEMIRDRESRFRLWTFGDRRPRSGETLLELFPAERKHAGPAPWLAVIRGGARR
jgi:curved DNA-binding protein CbpA